MKLTAIKNKTNRAYSGAYGGVCYDFKPGEIKILDMAIAEHLSSNSQYSAIGEKFLHLMGIDAIEKEIARDTRTIMPEVVKLENTGKSESVTMYDAKEFRIVSGGHIIVPEFLAQELIMRDSNLVRCKMEVPKPEPKKEDIHEANKNKKMWNKKG